MNALLSSLAELSGLAAELRQAALLVFLRVGAAMALIPGFGETTVPLRVRLGVTLAFSAVILPAMAGPASAVKGPVLAAAGTEVAAGLALGIGLRLFVAALQIAGAVIAQATSLSQLSGGAAPEPQPAMTHLLVWAGLALAMAGGLHVRLAELFLMSYQFWPVGQLPSGSEIADWGLAQISAATELGVSLATPFVLASMLYNLALAVINKFMPGLMVSFIGAPALSLGALILLSLVSPVLLSLWQSAFEAFLATPLGGM